MKPYYLTNQWLKRKYFFYMRQTEYRTHLEKPYENLKMEGSDCEESNVGVLGIYTNC